MGDKETGFSCPLEALCFECLWTFKQRYIADNVIIVLELTDYFKSWKY